MPLKDKSKLAEYNKNYRQNNKEYFVNYYQKFKDLKLNYKKDKCCALCGYRKHIEILSFHHINPKEKEREMNIVVCEKTFKKEIAKCVLLCPNCHMWHHFQRGRA